MSTRATPTVTGLHHVTAIAGDPQRNLDFYTGAMGMRLVKRSVNQDAPDTYHLFYADAEGHAGSDLTFFPWPELPPGRRGVGLTNEVALAIPPGTLDWWSERLRAAGIRTGEPTTWFDERVLPFTDPDGLGLALVETDDSREFTPWAESPVDASRQIRGLHAVRLAQRDLAPTARVPRPRTRVHRRGRGARLAPLHRRGRRLGTGARYSGAARQRRGANGGSVASTTSRGGYPTVRSSARSAGRSARPAGGRPT